MRLLKSAIRRYIISIGMFWLPFSFLRVWLLRFCGVKIGKGCYIGFNVICDTNFPEMLEIRNHVTISHNTLIFTHTITPSKCKLSTIYRQIKKVKICDGAWVGANCTILPGVKISENSMVGAGSVVSKDTQPNCLYAGNPCKRIKELHSLPK